ncbi:hypothetical protein HTZ77_02580 [Nonomuraea sp. SMC257]|uniref:Uncharacterized protein n=1 Tax=Nonomuraea montanisoli TaxID=2741721 RepID=A0A7Y6M1E1_9ACTN|nr:hypothetical protein [Nonomuraea montanisoli]NUW30316.1 hypothetical protein [Nonomuraea montanisoli]
MLDPSVARAPGDSGDRHAEDPGDPGRVRESEWPSGVPFAIMAGVLTMRMNDAAADLLGIMNGLAVAEPPGGLSPGLRECLTDGIVRRGEVVTWESDAERAERAPAAQDDLTSWERTLTSLHLEDHVPVDVVLDDEGAPWISEEDQRTLLVHGIAFALEFGKGVHALEPPTALRLVVDVNETNGTFRFSRIRPADPGNDTELDGYRHSRIVMIDVEPARVRGD